jgi:hypothetical protein
MDNVDGEALDDAKKWMCRNGRALGVVERVRAKLMSENGTSLRYYTTRLALFRRAVDLGAERPVEIEVIGALDGNILSMRCRCSECGVIEEWHPAPNVVNLLVSTYVAE